jgi:hypothetical protein
MAVMSLTPCTTDADANCAGSDIITIRRALETYEDIDVNFAGSRESELLKVPRQSAVAPAD